MRTAFLAALSAALLLSIPISASASDASKEAARGDYSVALERLEKATKRSADDEVLLAEIYLTVGRYKDALKQAAVAAKRKGTRASAEVIGARASVALGDYGAAKKRLRKVVKKYPKHFEARVRLAEVEWLTGKARRSFSEADEIATYWEQGDVTGRDLVWLGRGLHLNEYIKDANTIFFEVREKEPKYAEGHLGHALLFLEKEDETQAGQAVDAVLARNPNHPEALVLAAQMDLSSDGDPKKATKRARKALAVNPAHVGAMRVLASAQVETEQYAEAAATLDSALEINAKDPATLALRAAVDLLMEDRAGFGRWMKKALAVNRRYAAGYHLAAELIVRVHRYREAIELDKEALRLDDEYAPAWVGLGVGLSRVGKDKEANEALQTAFELDSFNVRAYNMTKFYYDGPVKEMSWYQAGPYRLRLHKEEATVLKPLVSELLNDAHGKYVKKYGFKPKGPLNVEVFRDKSTFEIRTAGYTRLGVHAVCFGHVITSRSPSEGAFNWGMVLWHELAHVWHIQMSKSRVPRWFTEGLAEFETATERPEWRREMDEVLHQWLVAGKLKGIAEFNSMFIHADGIMDVVVAYYYATQVVRFIDAEWGFKVMPKMLRGWGEKKTTEKVFAEVLKITPSAFDERLQTWLRGVYLARYRDATKPSDAPNATEAERAYYDGLLAEERRDSAGALTALKTAIEKGGDGPNLRLDVARMAIAQEDYTLAREHLEKAGEQDPQRVELHELLLGVLKKVDAKDAIYKQRQHLATLKEDDVGLALEVAVSALQRDDKNTLIEYAERALEVAPFVREVRVIVGRARLKQNEPKAALAEAELALDLPGAPDGKSMLGAKLVMAEAYLQLGRKADARRTLKDLPADNSEVQSLRKRL